VVVLVAIFIFCINFNIGLYIYSFSLSLYIPFALYSVKDSNIDARRCYSIFDSIFIVTSMVLFLVSQYSKYELNVSHWGVLFCFIGIPILTILLLEYIQRMCNKISI